MTLGEQDHIDEFAPDELNKLLAVANGEIERGEVLDGEEVFHEIRKLGEAE